MDLSKLAVPLPSNSAILPSRSSEVDLPRGGPGSVMISETDLSSPLNYRRTGLMGSSINISRTGVGVNHSRIKSNNQLDKRLRTDSQPEGYAVPSYAGNRMNQSETTPPSVASETAVSMLWRRFPDTSLTHQIQVRNMRTLGPEDIDQLITITGMVINVSDLIPKMGEAVFRCSVCFYAVTADLEVSSANCQYSSTNHSFSLVHNRSCDQKILKLQETPDDMPAGQIPHNVILYVNGELVDDMHPGDRVSVTGVYRAVHMIDSPIMQKASCIYKTHIDVAHISKTDASQMHGKEEKRAWEPKIDELEQLSKKPDIYERPAMNILQVDGGDDPPDEEFMVPDVHDNHIAKVRDVFFKEKSCMVRLELQFFPTTNNDHQSHQVILPLDILEDNHKKAKREIRDQVLGIVPFIYNLEKYCNKIVGDVQHFMEHKKNGEVPDKPFIRHDRPTVFEYEEIMYYNCGQLWRLTEPGHLIKPDEREELPFFLVFTGKPKEYVDDMKALVEGLLLLLDQMTSMQPVPEDHSWPFIKMAMYGQTQLYPVISMKYGQATIITNSGESTNVGKTYWQVLLDLLCTGFHEVSGNFTEKTVFDRITAGSPFIVDEITDYKKQGPIVQVVVSHTFDPKERSVGKGGGKPKAAFMVNCNTTRSTFKFPKSVDSKVCWIFAGTTPLQSTSEDCQPKELQKKMKALALQLHSHYPNFLMLATECFQNPISDDELKKMRPLCDDNERLGQILINVKKFSEKLKEQAALFQFQVPDCVKQVDFGPILVNYDDENKATIEDLFQYFIDNDLTDKLKYGKKNNIEGFRFNGKLVVNCPPKIYKLVSAIKSEPDKGKRWKFVRTDDVEDKYMRKLEIGNLDISHAWNRDSARSNWLRGKLEAELISFTKEDGRSTPPDPPPQEKQQKSKTKSKPKTTGGFKCTIEDCDKAFGTQRGMRLHLTAKHKEQK